MSVEVLTFKEFRARQNPRFLELLHENKRSLFKERGLGELVTSGERVNISETSLRGHGILKDDIESVEEDEEVSIMEVQEVPKPRTVASVTGILQQVNQLQYVEALHSKYVPEPGDVVVGRVTDLGQARWHLDIGAISPGILQLSAIQLPTGEQRRKTDAEAVDMRRFFLEDDLVSSEVQKVGMDGSVMLHTRSARYGKLQDGCLVCVPPTLTIRLAHHMVTLDGDVHLIIGKNGFIFIGSLPILDATDTLNFVAQRDSSRNEPITPELRRKIALVRRAIVWLARNFMKISPQTIQSVVNVMREHGETDTLAIWDHLLSADSIK